MSQGGSGYGPARIFERSGFCRARSFRQDKTAISFDLANGLVGCFFALGAGNGNDQIHHFAAHPLVLDAGESLVELQTLNGR